MARDYQVAISRRLGWRQYGIQRRDSPPVRKEVSTLDMRGWVGTIIIVNLNVLDKREVRIGALVRVFFVFDHAGG